MKKILMIKHEDYQTIAVEILHENDGCGDIRYTKELPPLTSAHGDSDARKRQPSCVAGVLASR